MANPSLSILFQTTTRKVGNLVVTDNFDWSTALPTPIDPVADNVVWTVELFGPPGNILFASGTITRALGETSFSGVLPTGADLFIIDGPYRVAYEITVNGLPYFRGTQSVEFCYEVPTGAFNVVINCRCVPVVTVTRISAIGTGTDWVIDPGSESITINPPVNQVPNTPIASAGNTVNSGSTVVNRGAWSITYTATVTKDYVTHSVEGIVSQFGENGAAVATSVFSVSCVSMCEINCLITASYTRWKQYEQRSQTALYNQERQNWASALLLVMQAWLNEDCGCGDGTTSQYELLTADIKKIFGISASASCCSDCGSDTGPVIPLCSVVGSGAIQTIGTDSGLWISIVGGAGPDAKVNLTTKAALTLQNVYNRVILGGAGFTTAGFSLSETIDNTTTPPTRTVTINFSGTLASQVQNTNCTLSLSFTGGGPVLSVVDPVRNGTFFKLLTNAMFEALPFPLPLLWPNYQAQIRIFDFLTTPPVGTVEFKQSVSVTSIDPVGPSAPMNDVQDVLVFTIQHDDGQWWLHFTDSTGAPCTWGYVKAINRSMDFKIEIIR